MSADALCCHVISGNERRGKEKERNDKDMKKGMTWLKSLLKLEKGVWEREKVFCRGKILNIIYYCD